MNRFWFIFPLLFVLCNSAPSAKFSASDDVIVQLFQEYIQIPSVSRSDLSSAVEFWESLSKQANVIFNVYEYVPNYPVIVLKWPGTDSSLPSILLNSHMDVVPANEEDGWTYPPFSGYIDDNGDLYGRGTQDTKSVALQHFEALRRLKERNITLLRDVYMSLMPDEEVGGAYGMARLAKSKEFEAMNVGIALDEGYTDMEPDVMTVFSGDKAVWQFRIDCPGFRQHGSSMPDVNTTAVGKCLKIINDIYKFREEQYKISSNSISAAAYTSINLNIIHGGDTVNTIPGLVSLTVDARLGCDVKEDQFLKQIQEWISNAGTDVKLTFLNKDPQSPWTRTDDGNPYWTALVRGASKANMKINPIVVAGAIDGRYLRAIGVPVFGVSPMFSTPLMAHQVNERLNVAVFVKGIEIMSEIVQSLANLRADEVTVDQKSLLEFSCPK